MKILVDVILVEGINEQEFVDSFNPETEADWWNMLDALPRQLVMHVEEDFYETFLQDPRLEFCEKTPQPVSVQPAYEYQTGTVITEQSVSTSLNGADFMPLQLYDDADVIPQVAKIGNDPDDDAYSLANQTYYSAFLGRDVDIVTLEVGPVVSSYNNYHTDPHPDFRDAADGVSRFIPTDWPGLEEPGNNQVTNGNYLTAHGIGVLSAAAGRICGFAKKANMYLVSLEANDSVTECISAITNWHLNKPNNPQTGVPNPTILINEYQYLLEKYSFVPVDNVESITTPDDVVNKPGGGWGTDFTPFVDRGIIPFRVLDNNDSTWKWCIPFSYGSYYSSLTSALETAWDNGIVVISASGNQGHTYVKQDDARASGTYCTVGIQGQIINDVRLQRQTDSNGTIVGFTSLSSGGVATNYYPFRHFGPGGLRGGRGIDVAAGQNSQTYPILDSYSNRGPGIDIIGKGSDTWTSYPGSTYADGRWAYFSGTSCATPTVVGKAACEMEKYYYYNGRWPTPAQVKQILVNQAKDEAYNVPSTNWSNVGGAGFSFTVTEMEGGATLCTAQVGYSTNGSLGMSDLAGNTGLRAFFNAQGFDRSQTQSFRPTSGGVYPRPKIRRT